MRLAGRVDGLYGTQAGTGFETVPFEALALGLSGIEGDRHGGETRRSGGREPWYPRGTVIRNERQLSMLAADELALAAEALGIPELRPEWIGANLLLGGIHRLSRLPPRTLLFFEGGATVRIDGDNRPCRASGAAVAARFPERAGLDTAFVKAAARRRGLVGWVEKPGTVRLGEAFEARLPEQWIYEPG